MLLKILKYPDPLLKKKCAPVENVDHEIRELVTNMFETMYASNGVGLAAPQLGILKNILVIDIGRMENEETKPDPIAIINPEIESKEGTLTWEEGCLSLPKLIVPVERSAKVIVKALNLDDDEIQILGEQLLAVALQHEIDHLEGILLVDRISRLKRDLYLTKMKKHEGLLEHIEAPRGKGYKPYIG